MAVALHDARACHLGEGTFWHPERGALFWVDILGRTLLSRDDSGARAWTFDRMVSAGGWIDRDRLLLATEDGLVRFDLSTGHETPIAALEVDRPETRSNDGRADPWGGFWIGTMGKRAEPGAGALYRYFRGSLRRLFASLTIPNAIAFARDGRSACFADTPTRIIHRVALDSEGWPQEQPEAWIDMRDRAENPDGAVFDAAGNLWVALWGSARVACFNPTGTEIAEIALPVPQPTCPAFGGIRFDQLFITSARENLGAEALAAAPTSGAVFRTRPGVTGRPEPRVIL